MEKLFNWTIGSFFRTIGRIIAYFSIGAIIAYILGSANIKLPFRINNLFLDKVKASAYDGVWIPWATYSEDEGNTWSNTSFSNDKYHQFSTTLNGNKTYMIKFNDSASLTNAKEIKFNIKAKLQEDDLIDFTNYSNNYTCTFSKNYDNAPAYYEDLQGNDIYYEDVEMIYNSFTCSVPNTYSTAEYTSYKMNITLMYFYNNNVGLQAPCYATAKSGSDIFSFTCPVVSTASSVSGVVLLVNTNLISHLDLGVSYLYSIENDSTQAIIDNQNQNTQAINNTITDTNTTAESNSTADYFNNQTDDTPSGLTTAVTAPLQILQNLVNGSTSPLCFTLNSKVSCIPDGSIIWGNGLSTSAQHWFSSGLANPKQSFITFFNLVVGGFLCYKMLLSMLRIWQNLLDPTRSTIEVMKL